MMKSKFLLAIAVTLLCLTYTDNIDAQGTHAHSTSRKWKGIDVLYILNHPEEFPGIYDKNEGYPIYLYNVGTGKFVIDGGSYGMEARLFHEDFGRQMKLFIQDGVLKINPDVTEVGTTDAKYLLTCNIPGITKGTGWADAYQYSLTTIMDGYYYWGKWNFQRVEQVDPNTPSVFSDTPSEFHTYYMYQQHDANYGSSQAYTKISSPRKYQGVDVKNIIFRFGAAYGEWCSDGTEKYGDNSTNDKGNGYYVNVDDDRSCWTTAGNANSNNNYNDGGNVSPWGNTTTVEVNGDQVTIDELYQWRIISEAEYEAVLNQEIVGINPSVSSLIPDRDFTRNSDDFFGHWFVTPDTPSSPETGEGRYGNTWGQVSKGTLQEKYNNEAWNSPVMLKKVFNNIKNAKLGFMSFEGIGSASVTFELPRPGWYQLECKAIHFSSDATHKAYMYGKANWVTVTDALREASNNSFQGYGQVELTREDGLNAVKTKYPNYFNGIENNTYRSNEATNAAIGNILTRKGDNYCHKFMVYVNPTNFDASDENKKFTLGFIKDFGTKKNSYKQNPASTSTTYYYDEDWICVDDIRMSYLGLAPAFFYEEEENLDYLVFDSNYVDQRPSAQPDGMYSGALSLERTMKTNLWNSFSFPIPLTGEQIRLAFGEDAELLQLDGVINNEVGKPYIINFTTVDLKQTVTDPTNVPQVVEPGKMYLLKPTADPVDGEDPFGRVRKFYELGRNFFSVDATQVPQDYSHTIIDTDNPYASQAINSPNHSNDGVAYVSYVQTPGYAQWKADPAQGWLDSNGEYCHTADGSYQGTNKYGESVSYNADVYSALYAPKGAYVMAGGRMYELNKDTRIKGFRGWITLTKSLFTVDEEEQGSVRMSIDGVVDGDVDITGIAGDAIPVPVAANTTVYDLCGRRVGTVGTASLPRGIYIVAGKKVFVK